MRGRDQPCVFHKIKKPVENIATRAFEWSHLESIKAVFPEAYAYTPCRVAVETLGGMRMDSVCLDMVDHCSVPGTAGTAGGVSEGNQSTVLFRPWGEQLAMRRLEFRRRLVDRVKSYHQVNIFLHGFEFIFTALLSLQIFLIEQNIP
jgi:hypothetical protein